MKYNSLIKRYFKAVDKILSDSKHWIEFLDTSSSITSYSFINRVLIHSYFPTATAIASQDIWNGLNRITDVESKKIFILNNKIKAVTRVYDISQTQGDSYELWQFDDSNMTAKLLKALNYEFNTDNDTLYDTIIELTKNIHNIIPSVKNLSESEQSFISNSVNYIVNKRLYQDSFYYDFEELKEVSENINVLGGCIAVMSNRIINTAKQISKTNDIYSNQELRYSYDLYSEVFIDSNKYNVIDISDDIITVSNPEFPLEQIQYKREEFENKLKETPLNLKLITRKEHNGEFKIVKSDELNETGQQYSSIDIGKSSERNNTQIMKESNREKLPDFDFSLLDNLFRQDNYMKNKKRDISTFFKNNPEENKRKDYLIRAYNEDYSELLIAGKRVGYKTKETGLMVWEGSYLSCTSNSILSWDLVAKYISDMIKRGVYIDESENEQLSIFDYRFDGSNHAEIGDNKRKLSLEEKTYQAVQELFPEILSQKYSYLKFDSNIYEPLSIEYNGLLYIEQNYIQNGDLMKDPLFIFSVDDSNKKMILKYKEQDGILNGYEEYDESNDDLRQLAQRYFVEDWLSAIKAQDILNNPTKGKRVLDNGSFKDVVFINGNEYNKGEEPNLQDRAENNLDEYEQQSEVNNNVEKNAESDIVDMSEMNAQNYVLSDKDFTKTVFSEKVKGNITAVKLLKEIESEERQATLEEQSVLAKYVGWGGLSDVFDPQSTYYNYELRNILTDKEYFAARASTLSAFYTGPEIINAVYSALEQFGFKNGNILEPAAGTGRFIGMCPESIKSDSKFYAVELDSISARITKLLYPGADVSSKGFEETDFKDNQFDVAIGNVPFGNYKVFDKKYDKENFLIHDYFFAKSIDLVKPNGIIAFVTSKGTLDKKSEKFRRYICERADFIGAIRLPGNAFKDAGTTVVSDIIFLQKKETPTTEVNETILSTIEVEEDYNYQKIEINNYFVQHPEMIAGELTSKSTAFGYDTDVFIPYGTDDLSTRLKKAVSKLNGKYISSDEISKVQRENDDVDYIPADPNIGEYSFGVSGNKIYYRLTKTMSLAKIKKSEQEIVLELIELAKITRTIINVQREEIESGQINDTKFTELIKDLNVQYDNFVKKYGYINENLKVFRMDNTSPLLSSIEIYNSENKCYEKSPFFFKRTVRPDRIVTHCESSLDALYMSLDQKNQVDLEYMAKLTGFEKSQLIKELAFKEIYPNHNNTEEWLYKEDYLSGNIRKKLNEAKEFLSANPDNNLIKSDISALEKVLPEYLTIDDISVKLGSPWIPSSYINSFIDYLGLLRDGVNCVYYEMDNSFYIENKGNVRYLTESKNIYGTSDASALFILEKTLNQKQPKVYDRTEADGKKKSVVNQEKTDAAIEKQELLISKFEEYCNNNPEELERIYNEKFNCKVAPSYDGSYLTFPGMSTEIELLPHQKNAVARCLRGNTLLAHCVGAGKTFEMIAAGQKMKQLGLCNKPIYVVPNHLVQSFAQEFVRLYPTADIIAVDKSDLLKENRKRFTSRIATGTFDGIIMAASSFEFLQLSDARKTQYYYDQIDELRDYMAFSDNDFSVKQAERAINSYQNKLNRLLDKTKSDNFIEFEDLGIDQMFIDEAHEYKNLYCPTRLGTVSGVNNSSSIKSENMLLKTEYLSEVRGIGKGTVFATGTPVSNYLTEMYVMTRYLAPEKLRENGCFNIDAWIGTFGFITNSVEINPSGNGFRVKERLNRFNNVPELLVDYYSFADVKTKENLKLPLPKVNKVTVTLEPSELQKQYIIELGERAEAIKLGYIDPSEDNFLKITTDGIKCALDFRLINPDAPDNPNSKINAVVCNAYKEYVEHSDVKGTQIIFLDRSTPKANGEFNLYDDIKDKLIDKGINNSEIVFIHQAKNDYEKQEIFDKVNAGEYRIILGSTEKLGTGTNIQERCCALHHVDLGWRPSDKEQRLGRMERQGNKMSSCTEYCYIVQDTFDAYVTQTLESKASFISQINRGDMTTRSIEVAEDIALEYTEIKALSCGDERIKTKIELEIEIKKLQQAKRRFNKNQRDLQQECDETLPIEIARLKNANGFLEKCIEIQKGNPPMEAENFKIYLYDSSGEKKLCIDKKFAGMYLLNAKSNITNMDKHKIAHFRGFDLTAYYSMSASQYRMALTYEEKECYSFEFSDSEIGMIARLNNAIDKGLPDKKKHISETISQKEERLASIKPLCNSTFEDEDNLKIKMEELKKLNKELNLEDSNDTAQSLKVNNSLQKTSYRR